MSSNDEEIGVVLQAVERAGYKPDGNLDGSACAATELFSDG